MAEPLVPSSGVEMSRPEFRMLSLLGTLCVLALANAHPVLALDGLKVRTPVGSFGAIAVGSCDLDTYEGCKIKTFTLENVGSVPVLIGGFGIREFDPPTAAVVPGTSNGGCEFLPRVGEQWSLDAGRSCTIAVAFNPVVKGRTENAVQIWSTDQSNPIAVVPLFGVGT